MAAQSDTARQLTDEQFAVLHGAALCQTVDVGGVAETIGLAEDAVGGELEAAIARGDLLRIRTSMLVSEPGQEVLAQEYRRRYAELREDAQYAEALDRFESVNKQLLAAMSDWQTVSVGESRVPNDHSDQDYDAAVIGRVGDIVDRVERVLAPFSATEPRIGRGCERLGAAVDRALAGEGEYISGISVPSVHTVWFQLHEDLLRLMGRERDE
jgi:hypothetical protein